MDVNQQLFQETWNVKNKLVVIARTRIEVFRAKCARPRSSVIRSYISLERFALNIRQRRSQCDHERGVQHWKRRIALERCIISVYATMEQHRTEATFFQILFYFSSVEWTIERWIFIGVDVDAKRIDDGNTCCFREMSVICIMFMHHVLCRYVMHLNDFVAR